MKNKSTQTAEIVTHSINPTGVEIVTFKLRYWRAIHGEFMTHRVFSRNASSSRAIPVATTLKQVWFDPAGPIHWGANQAGMQANEQLTGVRLWLAQRLFFGAGKVVCLFAWGMKVVGLHKQVANRILEPWQYISVVATATELDNFYHLRRHKDAQPEFQDLAKKMFAAQRASLPNKLKEGEWHLPFVSYQERTSYNTQTLLQMSTARCARVSYLTHEGKTPSVKNDVLLHDRLVASDPIHASPTEHQAQALNSSKYFKNFKGLYQYRYTVEADAKARQNLLP